MQKGDGTAENPYEIDPSLRLAWPLLFNWKCDSECEMSAFMEDVTPQLLTLQPGDVFVFPVDKTRLFVRIEQWGKPYITTYPRKPKDRPYPLEDPDGGKKTSDTWRKFWDDNFNWSRDLDQLTR